MDEFIVRAGRLGLKASPPTTSPGSPAAETGTFTQGQEITCEESRKLNDHGDSLGGTMQLCQYYDTPEDGYTNPGLFNPPQTPLSAYFVVDTVPQSSWGLVEASERCEAGGNFRTGQAVVADSRSGNMKIAKPAYSVQTDPDPTGNLDTVQDSITRLHSESNHFNGNAKYLLAHKHFASGNFDASTENGQALLGKSNGLDPRALAFRPKERDRAASEEILNPRAPAFTPDERDAPAREEVGRNGFQRNCTRCASATSEHKHQGPRGTKVDFDPEDLSGSEIVITINGWKYTAKLKLEGPE